jgi:hypothetical protein
MIRGQKKATGFTIASLPIAWLYIDRLPLATGGPEVLATGKEKRDGPI